MVLFSLCFTSAISGVYNLHVNSHLCIPGFPHAVSHDQPRQMIIRAKLAFLSAI